MSLFRKQYLARVFWRDKQVFSAGVAALFLNLVAWAMLVIGGLPLRGQALVPLHYTIYFGVDLVGPWHEIFIPALFGLLALLVNFSIILRIYETRRVLAYIYAWSAVFVELILLAASFFIILLNA